MSILVVLETAGNGYRSSGMELLSKARSLESQVIAVVFGGDSSALNGLASKVVAVKGGDAVGALAGLIEAEKPALVLFGESTRTREIMPRLAARTGNASFANAVGLEKGGDGYLLTKPVYGGKAYGAFSVVGTTLAAFRPNSFPVDAAPISSTSFDEISVNNLESKIKIIESKQKEGGRVDLVEAERVVAAGRGMKAPENLKLVEELADALGGAVGVSRAIVDAGWADHSIQVGKSGKTVAPALYFAIGISGAVHHTMGMDTSKVVVAINTDPKAPIFNYADYGIVGDALAVVPALTAELKKAAG